MSSKYAGVTQDLLNLYKATPKDTRDVLHHLVRELQQRLISDALAAAGWPRKSDYESPGKHIWRSQLKKISGQEPDHTRYCEAELKTRGRSGCANRPMMGAEHCKLHSTPEEIAVATQAQMDWKAYLNDVVRAAGDYQLVHDIEVAMGDPE